MSDSELFEHFNVIASLGQEPLRVDKFLMNFMEGVTRSKIQNAIKQGSVYVNGLAVKSNYKVKGGDEVQLMMQNPPRENEVIPEDLPINIVYEDESVLVVNKEAGMVVHPGHGNYSGTLVNALKFHFNNLPSMSAELERPGLVHRIDKETSGLLVIAKTEQAMQHLAEQFANHTTKRQYHALVWGVPKEEQGTITGHIGRHLKNRLLMDVFTDGSYGKHAITHYKILKELRYISYVQCELETGRTHQIRAHFKHLGHPLFNDERYGGNAILKGTSFSKYKQFVDNCFKICPRQALHAKTLGFIHPLTQKEMNFECDLPQDFSNCLEKWESYLQYN